MADAGRSLRILQAIPLVFADATDEPRFADVAAKAGVPVSSAYRLRERSTEIDGAWRNALAAFRSRSARPHVTDTAKPGRLRSALRAMAVHLEATRLTLLRREAELAALRGSAPSSYDLGHPGK